ncbi:MAG: hypothetical protein Q9173_006432 [Seirophora scorigena]
MSSTTLHTSLLRPPILRILRAAGFHATKPHVLDTLVDLAARYLSMLALNATAHAQENHNDPIPTITDVRMALEDVGAFQPQKSAMEQRITGKPDGSGVDAFLRWMKGEENREIRRIAGLVETDGLMLGIDMPTEKEDFLTALKKKHNKTGESSRFQGTVLGSAAEDKILRIEGGPSESLQDWSAKLGRQHRTQSSSLSRQPSSALTSTEPIFDRMLRKKSEISHRGIIKTTLNHTSQLISTNHLHRVTIRNTAEDAASMLLMSWSILKSRSEAGTKPSKNSLFDHVFKAFGCNHLVDIWYMDGGN